MNNSAFLMLAAVSLAPAPAWGQADPVTTAATERIKAETELEKSRAERSRAEADRIKALGLPSFEGKTEQGTNAGAMEATLLTGVALGEAASAIAGSADIAKLQGVILLTLAETLDMGQAEAFEIEMNAIAEMFEIAEASDPTLRGGSPAAVIGAVGAVAGLLRSDASLSYIDVAAVDDRMLVWAVAQRLGGKAKLPSAAIGKVGKGGKELYDQFDELAASRLKAEAERAKLTDVKEPTKVQAQRLKAYNDVVGRFDAFAARVTKPDDKGVVPIVAAGRMADLLADNAPVLRLHVDRAGGSLVNTRNIATTFGVDPLKVSGGLLASFLLTDPNAGTVISSDVIACHTTLTSIRKVQERRWRTTDAGSCKSVLAK